MEKQLCSLAAQRMRSEMTELLSLLPAARRDPALDEPGAYALDCAALCAYRCLRDAQNISAWGTLHSPPRRPVCVSACAEAFVHAAAAVCPGVRFSYVPPASPLWSRTDAQLFAVCLGNLIRNAALYGPDAPKVSLSLRRCGRFAVLTVSDPGEGFPLGAGRPLCSMGRCGERTGLGLGLGLAQRFAAAYGGRFAVRTASRGGTAAALTLPLCLPGEAAAPPDFAADRFSAVYVQLAGLCRLPL